MSPIPARVQSGANVVVGVVAEGLVDEPPPPHAAKKRSTPSIAKVHLRRLP